MAPRMTKAAIRQEIIDLMQGVGQDAAQTLGADLDDYSAIGELMTDIEECLAKLTLLNTDLWLAARDKGIIDKKEKKRLKHAKDGSVKHKKILTDYFAMFEQRSGFNRGISHKDGVLPPLPGEGFQRRGMPSGPATLTSFVPSDAFRSVLLRHAYHWKDAGVGVSHGEFTHRLQWWILITCNQTGGLKLSKEPVDLFKRLANQECIGKGKGVWDILFDMNSKDGPSGETFRRPETLHAYLRDPKTQASDEHWVLSQLIDGRAAKRKALQDKNIDIKNEYRDEIRDKRYGEDRVFGGGSIFIKPGHEKRWG